MLSDDTISLRHLPRRSSKNCDLQFANNDRFKANYTSIDSKFTYFERIFLNMCYVSHIHPVHIIIIIMIIIIMIVLAEKSSREGSRLLLDHKEDMEELHKDLNERDDKIEQLDEDLHIQLQVKYVCP